ncbi:MAG: YbaN family protein [Faecousia sp.]
MKLKKAVYIVIGCLGVGLGAVGAVVPMLPAVPFLMLAAFCFAKSSKKLHGWFTGTKLYQDNLADFAAGKGMTLAAKRRIMLTVTLLMAFGFVMMLRKSLYIPCAILACVWAVHVLYFAFGIKTLKAEAPEKSLPEIETV